MPSKEPKPLEHEVQAAIVDAITHCGFVVFETTAFRQKESSGVDKGIPDLLVACTLHPFTYFGIEVKRPGNVRFTSPEQKQAYRDRRFVIAQSVQDALAELDRWLADMKGETNATARLRAKIASFLKQL